MWFTHWLCHCCFSPPTCRYFIDEKSSSFTEVTNVLKKRGVDLDNNRFLILQGEVELISQMKPKGANPHEEGLLEYLEDIIGSNKYVDAIGKGVSRCLSSQQQ